MLLFTDTPFFLSISLLLHNSNRAPGYTQISHQLRTPFCPFVHMGILVNRSPCCVGLGLHQCTELMFLSEGEGKMKTFSSSYTSFLHGSVEFANPSQTTETEYAKITLPHGSSVGDFLRNRIEVKPTQLSVRLLASTDCAQLTRSTRP